MERLDERSFSASTESIHAARSYVRQTAEEVMVDVTAVADVELAASELISNAIEHGSGPDFRVYVGIDDDHFVLEVASRFSGAGFDDPSEWKLAPPEALSGRGLGLVKAMSAGAWVVHADGTLTVGCRFAGG